VLTKEKKRPCKAALHWRFMTFSSDLSHKIEITKVFDEREKEEVKKLHKSQEYQEASEIEKMEFRLALKIRNVLRID
jgi:hypothetical protein